MDVEAQLALLREAAQAVARHVRTHPFDEWARDLGKGADGTSMKMVDEIAEKEIVRVLRERGAPWDLLSEGGGHVRVGGKGLLVTDPIDGTTNAIRGIPFYCVSLAAGFERLSDVECGVVLNVPTGDLYEAARGGGARLNGAPIRVREPPTRALVVSTTHGADVGATGLRSFGASALEMCLVASGALDAYHYPKPILRTTDVAAAMLIVREAGGVVLDDTGHDLDLPLSLVPRFSLTAASSREMAQRLGVLPE